MSKDKYGEPSAKRACLKSESENASYEQPAETQQSLDDSEMELGALWAQLEEAQQNLKNARATQQTMEHTLSDAFATYHASETSTHEVSPDQQVALTEITIISASLDAIAIIISAHLSSVTILQDAIAALAPWSDEEPVSDNESRSDEAISSGNETELLSEPTDNSELELENADLAEGPITSIFGVAANFDNPEHEFHSHFLLN